MESRRLGGRGSTSRARPSTGRISALMKFTTSVARCTLTKCKNSGPPGWGKSGTLAPRPSNSFRSLRIRSGRLCTRKQVKRRCSRARTFAAIRGSGFCWVTGTSCGRWSPGNTMRACGVKSSCGTVRGMCGSSPACFASSLRTSNCTIRTAGRKAAAAGRRPLHRSKNSRNARRLAWCGGSSVATPGLCSHAWRWCLCSSGSCRILRRCGRRGPAASAWLRSLRRRNQVARSSPRPASVLSLMTECGQSW